MTKVKISRNMMKQFNAEATLLAHIEKKYDCEIAMVEGNDYYFKSKVNKFTTITELPNIETNTRDTIQVHYNLKIRLDFRKLDLRIIESNIKGITMKQLINYYNSVM